MNALLNTLLRLDGMPQETIDKIEAASPPAAELVKLVKDNGTLIREAAAFYAEAKPVLDRAVALYQKAQPLIDKATPLVGQAWADVEKVLPAAQEVLAFLQAPADAAVPSAADRLGAGPT